MQPQSRSTNGNCTENGMKNPKDASQPANQETQELGRAREAGRGARDSSKAALAGPGGDGAAFSPKSDQEAMNRRV